MGTASEGDEGWMRKGWGEGQRGIYGREKVDRSDRKEELGKIERVGINVDSEEEARRMMEDMEGRGRGVKRREKNGRKMKVRLKGR